MHLKFTRFFMAGILAAAMFSANAQSPVIIPNGITLLKDSIGSHALINSLNDFLSQKDGIARENKNILPGYLSETAALVDELKGANQNAKLKDNDFYKPYLTNVVAQGNGDVLIQLSYVNATSPAPHASYRIMARKQGDQFYFFSPLRQQTLNWKSKTLGNITCFYQDTLNLNELKAYQKTLAYYNTKLHALSQPTRVYYCNDLPQALQIIGVEYKADYNGLKSGNLSTNENGIDLHINGSKENVPRIDPHDLFHERLRAVMSPDVINRPVDEGCAYLYGGSWGYSWPEIKSRFKKWLDANPNPDWLNYYTTVANFEAGQKPLKVNYVLNALIAEKLEKEKGFPAVMELLGCGKREPGDANYFRTLEKLTGVNKANFNVRIGELITIAYK
jgi:hypothetical protein